MFSPQTDKLGRNAGREVWNNNAKLAAEYIYYRKVGDHATNMPSSVYFGKKKGDNLSISENIKYAYDKMGNICRIDENGEPVVWYKYDALNRLVREDNKEFGKTWLYSYDNKGNIVSKRTTNFTLKEDVEECVFEESQQKKYEYDGDKLLSFGTEACAYDEIGNPKIYRGKSVSWSNGRQMVSYNGTAFTYDGLGRRLSKGNISYTYDSNGKVIKQSNGIEFLYDNSGVAGIVYNNATYIYRKDAQGNIVALIDSNGNVVVEYKYDAWGNHAVLYWNKVNDKEQYSDVDEAAFDENYAKNKTLAELNPFRYRGYYYDDETGLYYLKSRYYDPETGRFITIDDITYIDPEMINGLNLYAYCRNNPVRRVDENGHAPIDISNVYSSITTFSEVIGSLSLAFLYGLSNIAERRDVMNLISKVISSSSKVTSAFGYIGIGITVLINVINNYKSGASSLRIVSDAIVDVGVGLATIAISAAIGTAMGSAVPILGNIVGAIAGIIVGVAIYFLDDAITWLKNSVYEFFKWGNSLLQNFKNWFLGLFD